MISSPSTRTPLSMRCWRRSSTLGRIEFHNVTMRYPSGFDALKDVSVLFEEGSMTFLTGHSGAGKTTLLKLLLCVTRPSQGRILVNEVNISQLDARNLRHYRQHVGTVFQDHNLLAARSVFDNVALPLRVLGMSERDLGKRVRAALTRVGLLQRESLLPAQLSVGEQQRVGIARAVVSRPKILLADEPTGNLDPELSRDIMALFQQFNLLGATVIVASHDRNLIRSMDKPVVELSHGELTYGGTYAT